MIDKLITMNNYENFWNQIEMVMKNECRDKILNIIFEFFALTFFYLSSHK